MQVAIRWRRRELNPYSQNRNDIASKPLTASGKSLGVSGEWVEYNDCRLMAEIDPTLKKIIHVWDTLPESIRKAVETICLHSIS